MKPHFWTITFSIDSDSDTAYLVRQNDSIDIKNWNEETERQLRGLFSLAAEMTIKAYRERYGQNAQEG